MSTSFNVYPVSTKNLKFGDVLTLAEQNTAVFFQKFDIQKRVTFKAEFISEKEETRIDIPPETPFEWANNENEYVWISILGVPGGTDVYCIPLCDPDNEDDIWWRISELYDGPNCKPEYESLIEQSKALNRYWYFRRSAGQTAHINLCYGMLAAAVAELTEGFLFSYDNAWEYRIFPCFADEFLKYYFNPDTAHEPGWAEWAIRCINTIKNDDY